MTRRVVLGKYNNGTTYGLRVSLPGIDALTGDSSIPGFSFDSEWTDIVKIQAVGFVAFQSNIGPITLSDGSTISNPPGYKFVHGLGYKAFMEARLYQSGSIIRDDYTGTGSSSSVGVPWNQSDFNSGFTYASNISNIGQFLVIVWQVAAPSG